MNQGHRTGGKVFMPMKMNPHIVPPSQHTLFMRGFNPNTEMNKIRDFFTKEGGKCSFDFFKVSQDGSRLFVALRFESKDVAKEVLSRYDNASVLGSKITITWFKDLRRARLKAMQHGQRWSYFYGHMKNGYNRGGNFVNKYGNNKIKSTVWRQPSKDDHRRSSSSSRSRSRSYSRSRSRSKSRSRSRSGRSRSRSRSWSRSHSRSRERSGSPSGYRHRSHSSTSSRDSKLDQGLRTKTSDHRRKRAWKSGDGTAGPSGGGSYKGDNYEPGAEPPAEKPEDASHKEEDAESKTDDGKGGGGWTASKKSNSDVLNGSMAPSIGSSRERPPSVSDRSRSRSSSGSERSREKERKKKKKKHRSKHRRHRRRHNRRHRESSDEEGQVSDYEEGERSPTPDHPRRYRKRSRHSSSSSLDSAMDKRRRVSKTTSTPLAQVSEETGPREGALPESEQHAAKIQTVDVPSQILDGNSPLHMSEGDDEAIVAAQNSVEPSKEGPERPSLDSYTPPLPCPYMSTDVNTGTAEKSDANKGGGTVKVVENVVADKDGATTNAEPPVIDDVGGATESTKESRTSARTPRINVGSKSLLDKYKASLKTSTATPGSSSGRKVATRTGGNPLKGLPSSHGDGTQAETLSASRESSSQPSAHVTRNTFSFAKRTAGQRPLSSQKRKTDSNRSRESGLVKHKVVAIRRKRVEIESAYRQDCETFATVVKLLLRKDPNLEERLQTSFRENLFDIGEHCIRELQDYIENVIVDEDA